MASGPTRVSIPENELPSLKLLAHADFDFLSTLAQALATQPPSLDVNATCRSVAEQTHLALETVRPIVGILWRLAFVQRRLGLAADAFFDALAAGLKEADGWDAADAESWSSRREYVARALEPSGTIAVAAKAGELLLEQQLVFCTARTLTDVRPVFDESAEHIQLFLPFHTLAITCHEAGETREIHIAMDLSDMIRLREQLERAERKETLVRQRLTDAGLSVIETGQEGDV